MRTPRPRIAAWFTAVGLLLLITFGRLPRGTKLWETLQDSGHAPAFFLVSVSILYLLFLKNPVGGTRVAARYLGTFAFCLLAGILVEWVQSVTGRRISLNDIGADTLGISCGMAGFAWYRGRAVASRPRQAVLISICLVSAGIAIAPLVWCIAAYGNRNAQFPVIVDFNTPLDRYFVSVLGSSTRLVSRPGGSTALQVTLHPDETEAWPGIGLYEPLPDWTGHQALAIDVTNSQDQPLVLSIRVHDKLHSSLASDRYTEPFKLAPHEATVLRIPLSTIAAAPETREMDMTHITGVTLQGNSTMEGREFVLGRIWLE